MLGKLWKAIIVMALLVAGYAFYQAKEEKKKRKEAEISIALASSRMINMSFQRESELTVSRLSGDVVTHQECNGTVFNPEQRTKAPATVEYKVSLKSIGQGAYGWNAKFQRLSITIPPVIVGQPNVDFAKQIVRQNGIFVSRECGLILQRKSAKALVAVAYSEASKPENMDKAREAARAAVQDLASGVLRGAGMSQVQVVVVLPGEASRLPNGERWDETRPLAEVLAQ